MNSLSLTDIRAELAKLDAHNDPAALLQSAIEDCSARLEKYNTYEIDRFAVSFNAADINELKKIHSVIKRFPNIGLAELRSTVWMNIKHRKIVLERTLMSGKKINDLNELMNKILKEKGYGSCQ